MKSDRIEVKLHIVDDGNFEQDENGEWKLVKSDAPVPQYLDATAKIVTANGEEHQLRDFSLYDFIDPCVVTFQWENDQVYTSDFYPVNCSCGIPGCIGLHEGLQLMRKDKTIVWKVPKEYKSAYADCGLKNVRYNFDRNEYEQVFKDCWKEIEKLLISHPNLRDRSNHHSNQLLSETISYIKSYALRKYYDGVVNNKSFYTNNVKKVAFLGWGSVENIFKYKSVSLDKDSFVSKYLQMIEKI